VLLVHYSSFSGHSLGVNTQQKRKRKLFPVTWFYKNRMDFIKKKTGVAFVHLVVTLIIDGWVSWATILGDKRVASDRMSHFQLPLFMPYAGPNQHLKITTWLLSK
jgi:hypothetical protein